MILTIQPPCEIPEGSTIEVEIDSSFTIKRAEVFFAIGGGWDSFSLEDHTFFMPRGEEESVSQFELDLIEESKHLLSKDD